MARTYWACLRKYNPALGFNRMSHTVIVDGDVTGPMDQGVWWKDIAEKVAKRLSEVRDSKSGKPLFDICGSEEEARQLEIDRRRQESPEFQRAVRIAKEVESTSAPVGDGEFLVGTSEARTLSEDEENLDGGSTEELDGESTEDPDDESASGSGEESMIPNDVSVTKSTRKPPKEKTRKKKTTRRTS